MMMMMNMTKTLTEQNGFFANFLFDTQACVGAISGVSVEYQWSLQVKIRSSEQSGKNSRSFKA